ncbi:hypothetical protein [Sinomicrobium sp.]
MKSSALITIVVFFLFSCKEANSIAFSSDVQGENISKKHRDIIDSLQHFTMLPSYFSEYYRGSNMEIENKAYMENCITELTKSDIPYLIEQIKDTAKAQTVYAGITSLRKGDIAFNLIQLIDRSMPVYEVIEKSFKSSNYGRNYAGTDRVFISLFFKEPEYRYVNYKNRIQLYKALKKYYKIENE